jgi:hypothetical protein
VVLARRAFKANLSTADCASSGMEVPRRIGLHEHAGAESTCRDPDVATASGRASPGNFNTNLRGHTDLVVKPTGSVSRLAGPANSIRPLTGAVPHDVHLGWSLFLLFFLKQVPAGPDRESASSATASPASPSCTTSGAPPVLLGTILAASTDPGSG